MIPEILLIDKPAGMSSFGVVARVRRVLTDYYNKTRGPGQPKIKRIKVGHAGTLDPFATGLLVVLVGKGTKLATDFLKLDKCYEATIRLGAVSTTGDIEGEIVENPVDVVSREIVEGVLTKFNGEIWQKVPAYSAVKINGRRAYELARVGKEVDTPTRKVTIYQIELVDYVWPDLKIRCHVSSGTYIRTLGEDIGRELGVGGYLTELRRTQIGQYKIENAEKLDDFMEKIERN